MIKIYGRRTKIDKNKNKNTKTLNTAFYYITALKHFLKIGKLEKI